MALTRCSECGNDISSSATKCPKCGKARITVGSVARTMIRLVLAVVIGVAVVVVFIIGRIKHFW